MKRGSESDLVSACLRLLQLRHLYAWRSNNVPVYDPARKRYRTFRGLRGVADILGCLPNGKLLAVECKTATGRLSAEQRAFLATVADLGGVAFCVRAVDELAELLDGLGL